MKKAILFLGIMVVLCASLKAQWERVDSLVYVTNEIYNADLVVKQDTIYLLANSGLYRTTNLGESWMFLQFPGAGNFGNTNCIELMVDTLVLGTSQAGVISLYGNFPFGFFIRHWMSVTEPFPGWIKYMPFAEARAMALKGFEVLVFANGPLYRTTDFGGSWVITGYPPLVVSGSPKMCMMYVGDTLYATLDGSSIGGALVKSGDNGATWTAVANNIPGGSSRLAGLSKQGSHWFVGAKVGGGIYTSTNGESYVNWSEGLPSGGDRTVIAYSFAVSGGYVFAGTNRGVFRRPLTQLSVPRGSERKTSAFELAQNYPNPFNPSTMIRYELPVASEVKLEVFDVLGKRVAKLVSGRQSVGEQRATFNASGLSSGVYFYRLEATATNQSFVETKKMILVK